MANRSFSNLQTLGRNQVQLDGYFAGADGYALNSVADSGIASVTHTTTGEYTINLSDKFSAFVGGHVQVQLASTADLFAVLGPVDLTAKTVKVFIRNGTTTANVSTNAGDRVLFSLRFRS